MGANNRFFGTHKKSQHSRASYAGSENRCWRWKKESGELLVLCEDFSAPLLGVVITVDVVVGLSSQQQPRLWLLYSTSLMHEALKLCRGLCLRSALSSLWTKAANGGGSGWAEIPHLQHDSPHVRALLRTEEKHSAFKSRLGNFSFKYRVKLFKALEKSPL